MKKTLFTLLLTGLLFNSFSQKLENGVYWFENTAKKLTINKTPERIIVALLDKKSVTQEHGFAVLKPKIENIATQVGISYVFKTDSCFYEFDISKTTLNLYATQCKNSFKDTRMVFAKKSFMSQVKWDKFVEEQKKKLNIK